MLDTDATPLDTQIMHQFVAALAAQKWLRGASYDEPHDNWEADHAYVYDYGEDLDADKTWNELESIRSAQVIIPFDYDTQREKPRETHAKIKARLISLLVPRQQSEGALSGVVFDCKPKGSVCQDVVPDQPDRALSITAWEITTRYSLDDLHNYA